MRTLSARIVVVACLVGTAAADEASPRFLELHDCRISLVDEAKVAAREAGVLVKVLVKKGDRVTKGQPLGQIDDDQPQMEKRKAEAEHAQAKAKADSDVDVRYARAAYEKAVADLEGLEQANERSPNSVSGADLRSHRLEVEKTRLQIEQSQVERTVAAKTAEAKQVEVEAADNAIERRVIRSPLDGYVNDVTKHEGEWMQPSGASGDVLAHVIDPDTLRVEGYVKLAAVPPAAVMGKPVKVVVDLETGHREEFTGKITFVSRVMETGEYRVSTEVENRLANGQELLPAGHFATMIIDLGGPAGP